MRQHEITAPRRLLDTKGNIPRPRLTPPAAGPGTPAGCGAAPPRPAPPAACFSIIPQIQMFSHRILFFSEKKLSF